MWRCGGSIADVALPPRLLPVPKRKRAPRLRSAASRCQCRQRAAQALYHGCGYVDAGVAPKRVKGRIEIRAGPIEVDDTILTWEKRLDESAP